MTEQNQSAFTLEKFDDGIAVLTMDVPGESMNTLKAEFGGEITTMLDEIEKDSDIKGVVLASGKSSSFVAGADITEFLGAGSEEITVKFTDNAIEALWNMSKPTIAMVDGFALGGGLEVACSCDIRIASSRSKFGTPEINLGLIPGYGGTQRLVSLLGYGKALECTLEK